MKPDTINMQDLVKHYSTDYIGYKHFSIVCLEKRGLEFFLMETVKKSFDDFYN